MSDIKIEDLKCFACDLMHNNQEVWRSNDPKEVLLYRLAFNDGILALLDRIQVELFQKEAADGRE